MKIQIEGNPVQAIKEMAPGDVFSFESDYWMRTSYIATDDSGNILGVRIQDGMWDFFAPSKRVPIIPDATLTA